MKRIISVFIVCFVILASLPLVSLAQVPAVAITSPVNGAKTAKLTSVEADINVDAEYVIIRLDGKEIGNAVPESGHISFGLEDALSVGSHTVDVIAAGEGISAIATNSFDIIFPYEMVIVDEKHENAPTVEKAAVTSKGTAMKAVSSHDGTKAFAWEIPDTIVASDKQTYTIGGTYDGPATIEVDMFFGTSLNMKIETKNKKGGWGSMFQDVFEKTVFERSGMILNRDGTKSDKSYVCGKWFRLKIEGDFSKGSASMHIGKFDEEGNVTYETVIPEMDMGENFVNLVQIRFEFAALTYFVQYADVKMIGIDNVKVTQKKEVSGLSSASFQKEADKVRVLGASQFKTSDFLPYISAYVDGKEIGVTSATADGDNLDITFEKPIGAQKSVEIVLNEDVLVQQNMPLGLKCSYTFETGTPDICIYGISYKQNDKLLYSPQQLKNGTLECIFNLDNKTEDEKDVILVAALYKGDEMINLSYLPYKIPKGESGNSVELDLPAEYNSTDYSIELFAIDSFTESIPLSKMWRIAK